MKIEDLKEGALLVCSRSDVPYLFYCYHDNKIDNSTNSTNHIIQLKKNDIIMFVESFWYTKKTITFKYEDVTYDPCIRGGIFILISTRKMFFLPETYLPNFHRPQ